MTNLYNLDNAEEAEIAQVLALQMNDLAVAQHRAKMPKGPSLEECEECGAEIPEARQKAIPGVRICIDCARRNELLGRMYATE